jgi:hypothetical protein
MDSAAGEMDQCVCALTPDKKLAVMLEFTRTGTQQQKAQQCSCCLRTYQYRLEAAYRELLGFLNDQAAGIELPSYEPEPKKDVEYA